MWGKEGAEELLEWLGIPARHQVTRDSMLSKADEDVEMPEPGPNEARVKLAASGVNFIDVYQRTGLYPGDLPRTLGLEGAGEVDGL